MYNYVDTFFIESRGSARIADIFKNEYNIIHVGIII